MKYCFLFIILCFYTCKNDVTAKIDTSLTHLEVHKSDLEIYTFNELEKLLHENDDKTHVVNFWATWCAPCIKEIPHFEKLNANYKDKNVEVLLVSLDFPFQYEKKLKPFIKENKLQSKVVALDDPDMNTWMPKISEEWTGAIPITIIYNK